MENSDQEFEEQQVKSNSNGGKRKSNRSPPYALFNLLVILTAIAYGVYYQIYVKDSPENSEVSGEQSEDDLVKIPMFTAEELKKYNGEGECNFFFNEK